MCLLRLQIRKTADERANAVDSKLAEMAAAQAQMAEMQLQIGTQVTELRAVFRIYKYSLQNLIDE